jgi:hypothetical protein
MGPQDQVGVPVAILASGVLIFCVCLPLIYGKIPMNRWYGIRIREAFRSDERWYDVNAYGGKVLAVWSLLPILVGAAGLVLPAPMFFVYVPVAVGAALISVIVPLIQILLWARATRET